MRRGLQEFLLCTLTHPGAWLSAEASNDCERPLHMSVELGGDGLIGAVTVAWRSLRRESACSICGYS